MGQQKRKPKRKKINLNDVTIDELRPSWKKERAQIIQFFIDIVHDQAKSGLITPAEAKLQLEIIPIILSEELDH